MEGSVGKGVCHTPGDQELGSARCAETSSDLHLHGLVYQHALKEAAAKVTVIKQVRLQASTLRTRARGRSPPGFPPFSPCKETGSRRDCFYSLLMLSCCVFSSSRPTPRTSAMVELNPGEGEVPSSPQKTSPLSKVSSRGLLTHYRHLWR